MEEDKDLKMIEEYYENYKKHLKNYEKDKFLTSFYYEIKRYREALENLIGRYNKLEEGKALIKKQEAMILKAIKQRVEEKIYSKIKSL